MSNTTVAWNNNAGRDVNIEQNQRTNIFNFSLGRIFNKNENSKEDSHERNLEFLKGKLLHLIDKSSYKDQDKRPCEAGTRLEILNEIESWSEDISKEAQCFYWLSGGPGVGKSAITASTAKYCIDHDILGAEFFINRNDETTTDPRVLFQTICWQLCNRFPQVAEATKKALRARPTLVDDISDQAQQLFAGALKAAVTNPPKAVVVVIDALDETDTRRLRDLAQILSEVVADLPQHAKVFISSRGEDAITNQFNPLRSRKQVKFRFLAAEDSKKEVSLFMEKRVREMLEEYGMSWDDWGDDSMEKLTSRASGLYIWAVTALKFFEAKIEEKGNAIRVEELLDILTAKGTDNIYALYLNILRKTCKPRDWEYERFRRIIGAILVRQTPLSIDDMGHLLALKDRDSFKPVDLVHFVRQYRTVLVHDSKKIDDLVVPKMHKSFGDFITSEWAHEFRVDKSASHGELALGCADQFAHLDEYLEAFYQGTPGRFPTQLVYAAQHWPSHLIRMIEPDMPDDVEEKDKYDTSDIPERSTQNLAPLNTNDLGPEAEKTRNYAQSITFSPDGTQIALTGNKGVIHIWDARTGSETMSLIGHKNDVYDVCFSPDGTQLISASADKTAIIWDVGTWRDIHVLSGHTGGIFHVTFSNDGRIVLTCSMDKTICSWDSQTGQLLKVFRGHKWGVIYCTFSPNDLRMASLSPDCVVRIWDVNSGDLISQIRNEQCEYIAFCPCNDHLITHRNLDTVILWDVKSGKRLKHAKSSIAPLPFMEDLNHGVASIHNKVPQGLKLKRVDRDTPHIYALKTKYGTVCGIVERDQGVWVFLHKSAKLCSVTGGTRVATNTSEYNKV